VNLLWTRGPPTRFVVGASQLTTIAVCCGCVSNLSGRGTVNIPEVVLRVHGLMGFTVTTLIMSLSLHSPEVLVDI